MMLLVDTNGLRKKANADFVVADEGFDIQPGYLKPALLSAFDWNNAQYMENLKYQLKLEMAASTNIRPLQRLFQQTPLVPDPDYLHAGWHRVMGNLVTRFTTGPDSRNLLMPAIYLETVLKGEMQVQLVRDGNTLEFDLAPGDAVYFSVHEETCSEVEIKRNSPTAISMSALYYVVDERYKELPRAAGGEG